MPAAANPLLKAVSCLVPEGQTELPGSGVLSPGGMLQSSGGPPPRPTASDSLGVEPKRQNFFKLPGDSSESQKDKRGCQYSTVKGTGFRLREACVTFHSGFVSWAPYISVFAPLSVEWGEVQNLLHWVLY